MMRALFTCLLLLAGLQVANAEPLTRVWGLYGLGDNWGGSSAGIDVIAEQARAFPNVEYVHIHNYYQTQTVYDAIVSSPADTRTVVYGYSCGANAMTVISHAFASASRKINAIAGIQQSLWCGGNDVAGTLYAQVTYGGCVQTLGFGCKKLKAAPGYTGSIVNIKRPDLHGEADNDPDAQKDVLDVIYQVANPPVEPPPPDERHIGHGELLITRGLTNIVIGGVMAKKGIQELNCYKNGCQTK